MKRATKASNVHGEVHCKQKQRLIIAFTGNALPDIYIYVYIYILYIHTYIYIYIYANIYREIEIDR